MREDNLKSPVAFIIFNRPETTQRVFEAIRGAQPSRLFIIADGPREDHPQDEEKCAAARAITERVDWKCDVSTNFADINMGCKNRISSGLDWVFNQVDQTIILEDDCLPHPTFFRFCQELLDRYKYDNRIMMISGDNYQFGRNKTEYSYYFSRYTHIWGWATWKRAWDFFDVNMELWPALRDSDWLEGIFDEERSVKFWLNIFDSLYDGNIDTWDYPWMMSCWIQNGLSILPSLNMVSNIGFGFDATNTISMTDYANIKAYSADLPLKHPPLVKRHEKADRHTQLIHYENRSLLRIPKGVYRRILSFVKRRRN